MGRGGDQRALGQARLFDPHEQVVREGDEVQEGSDGVELSGAQVLDIVDVTRLRDEGFDRGALVVEGEQAGHAPLCSRKGRVEESVLHRPVRLVQCVDDAAIAVQGGDLDAMHGLRDGYPLLQGQGQGQGDARGGGRGPRLEHDIARRLPQACPRVGATIPGVEASDDVGCRVLRAEQALDGADQVGQALPTAGVARVQVQRDHLLIGPEVGQRELTPLLAPLARKIPLAVKLVGAAVGDHAALVDVNDAEPNVAADARLLAQELGLDLPQFRHVCRREAREVAVDLRLVREAEHPQVVGRHLLLPQRVINRLRMRAAHHKRGDDRFRLVERAVAHRFHRDVQQTVEQSVYPTQPTLLRLFQRQHQECRHRLLLLPAVLERYGTHQNDLLTAVFVVVNKAYRAGTFMCLHKT